MRKRKVEGRGRGKERKRMRKKEEGKEGKGNWKWSFGRNGKNRKRPSRESNPRPQQTRLMLDRFFCADREKRPLARSFVDEQILNLFFWPPQAFKVVPYFSFHRCPIVRETWPHSPYSRTLRWVALPRWRLIGLQWSACHGKEWPRCRVRYKSDATSIALMHVTSWSESYPLRNSLMGVRGFRQVFVQSFHLSAFVLERPALLALERQSQEMRFFSSPKTTSVGRLFEGETQALNEEVILACRWGLRRWRKANLQIVKRYVKVCSSSQSSFFDATAIEEVMATWLLSEEVFESNRHFDDSGSCGSQFRSSHKYARQSG